MQKLRNYFGIAESEWTRTYSLAMLHFLIAFGCEIGRVGRDTFFLSNVGSNSIPLMYIFIALLMFVLAGVYGAVVSKISAYRFLIYYQSLGAILLLTLWYILNYSGYNLQFFPYIVFCTAESYIAFILIHFWAICNETFDAFEGKRLFPLLGAAGLIGTIAGGAGTFYLAHTFGSSSLFCIWSLVLVLSIPLTLWCNSIVCKNETPSTLSIIKEKEIGLVGLASIKRIWNERLMRTLTYMAFPMWVIVYIIEFYYYDTLNKVFINEEDLAGFLGIVVSLSSAIGLLIQCLVTPFLLKRFGVGSTGVVYPLSLTFGAISLLAFSLFPASTGSSLDLAGIVLLVVLARFSDIAIYFSVYDSALQLLYYAVPLNLRSQGRAFIAGMIFPFSIALAGALLMWFSALEEPIHNVTFVGVSLGFLLIVLSLNVTPDYLKALLANIDHNDKEQKNEILQEITKLEPSDIRYVFLQSLAAKDHNEALFAVDKIFEVKDEELFSELHEIIPNAQPDTLRAILEKITPEECQMHPRLIKRIEQQLALLSNVT